MCAVLLSTTNPSWEILVPAAEAAVEYGIRAQSTNCQTIHGWENKATGSTSRSAHFPARRSPSARRSPPLGSPSRSAHLPLGPPSCRLTSAHYYVNECTAVGLRWCSISRGTGIRQFTHCMLHAAWRPNLVWSVREQIIRKPRSAILKFELNAMFLSNTPRRDSEALI